MNTINIEKLEELINEKWNFNKKKFKLEKSYMVGATVVLHMLNNKENTNGEEEDKAVFWVNEKNYKELEFYGLKVILNEKPNPKLTREEREYLSAEWYIARDDDGKLFFYHMYPKRNEEYKEWEPNVESRACALEINRTLFPFITWESGKAWSKSELLELEVVE